MSFVRLSPPTTSTFLISFLIMVVALVAHFVPQVAATLPFSGSFWAPVVAYFVLMLGVVFRGV